MTKKKDESPDVVEQKSFKKLKKVAKLVGKSAAQNTLLIIYALRSDKTPAWAKGVLFSALVYFLTPIDTIPDFIPGAGYGDDISVILAALAGVSKSIDDEMKVKAKEVVDGWFSEDQE